MHFFFLSRLLKKVLFQDRNADFKLKKLTTKSKLNSTSYALYNKCVLFCQNFDVTGIFEVSHRMKHAQHGDENVLSLLVC